MDQLFYQTDISLDELNLTEHLENYLVKHGVPSNTRNGVRKIIDAIKSERKMVSVKINADKTVHLYIAESNNVWIDIGIYSVKVCCSHNSQSYLVGTQDFLHEFYPEALRLDIQTNCKRTGSIACPYFF